jgi:ADP-ribosylglycohydrolase
VPEKHISGLIGMIPVAAWYADSPDTARQLAIDHLRLTHLGDAMGFAGEVLLDLLLPALNGASLSDTIVQKVRRQDNPLLGYPLERWLNDPDEVVIGRRLSTACYVQDAVPAIVYLALKYHDDPARGLVANTQLGGDNAGRGAVLGALLGAANGCRAFPDAWVSGLCLPPSKLTVRQS